MKHKKMYLTDENGRLELWLRMDANHRVENMYQTKANTEYICRELRVGDEFRLQANGSWFCGITELIPTIESSCFE
jgi:hypothetical protein